MTPGGRCVFKESNSQKKYIQLIKRIWKEIFLKLSNLHTSWEFFFYSLKCTCSPIGRQLPEGVSCCLGWLRTMNTTYNEYLSVTQSLSLLTPLSIQNRSGILSGESSLLYPKFHNKIGWVKAVKTFQIIQKVCIQQLVRRDLTTDYRNVTVFYESLMALSHSLHQTELYK